MELHLHCGLGWLWIVLVVDCVGCGLCWLWIVLVVCTSRLLGLSSGYPDELEIICCECECSFCQNVTGMWLPLQRCYGDCVYRLLSFTCIYCLLR
jgi:hypothetical protein